MYRYITWKKFKFYIYKNELNFIWVPAFLIIKHFDFFTEIGPLYSCIYVYKPKTRLVVSHYTDRMFDSVRCVFGSFSVAPKTNENSSHKLGKYLGIIFDFTTESSNTQSPTLSTLLTMEKRHFRLPKTWPDRN